MGRLIERDGRALLMGRDIGGMKGASFHALACVLARSLVYSLKIIEKGGERKKRRTMNEIRDSLLFSISD
jgi:hypothetical protein